MSRNPQSGGESQDPSSTVTFSCAKCGSENRLQPDQKELLFGGTDAAPGGAVRPTSAGPRSRTLIVRCCQCQHANRIRLQDSNP